MCTASRCVIRCSLRREGMEEYPILPLYGICIAQCVAILSVAAPTASTWVLILHTLDSELSIPPHHTAALHHCVYWVTESEWVRGEQELAGAILAHMQCSVLYYWWYAIHYPSPSSSATEYSPEGGTSSPVSTGSEYGVTVLARCASSVLWYYPLLGYGIPLLPHPLLGITPCTRSNRM